MWLLYTVTTAVIVIVSALLGYAMGRFTSTKEAEVKNNGN